MRPSVKMLVVKPSTTAETKWYISSTQRTNHSGWTELPVSLFYRMFEVPGPSNPGNEEMCHIGDGPSWRLLKKPCVTVALIQEISQRARRQCEALRVLLIGLLHPKLIFKPMRDVTSMCAYVLHMCVHANSNTSKCIPRSILSTVSLTRSSMSSRKSSKRSTCILYFCTSAIAAIADATSCKGLGHKRHRHNKHKKIQRGCFEGGNWFGRKQPLAATCGHSLGTVWSGHLRPLAATCGHLLGTVWSGHLRPLAATCGHSLGTIMERPLAATCGHLRPLAWNSLERPLAATCGHLHCGHSFGTVWSGHLRPFAVTSGCKLLPCTCLRSLLRPLAPAAICSQTTRGYKWLQAAVSALHAGGHTWQSWHLE